MMMRSIQDANTSYYELDEREGIDDTTTIDLTQFRCRFHN